MTKFWVDTDLETTLFCLGLEYQYLYEKRKEGYHSNRIYSLDGTVILEVEVWENSGKVVIKDNQGEREFTSINLDKLHLLIIDIGGTLSPKIPHICIRILYNHDLLHHSTYKQ